MTKPKIIVLDDDPTGSQTVHSCLLLLRWDVETLRSGLKDESPIVFVLTNTRALSAIAADAITREVCQNLKQALEAEQIEDFLIVSRSDSTLRGHYPIETDAIAQELGGFDAHFLVPAFFEGGRITRDSVHYLIIDGIETPVHETEFARDSVFGYSYSYLPDYVEEKTQGQILAKSVDRLLLADIRAGTIDRLMNLKNNQCVVVDGEIQADLNQFAADLLTAASRGKRFLLRSAASILTALADLPPQPVAPEDMGAYTRDGKPGAIVVGSHVRKTTEQLEQLLNAPGVAAIEVDVSHLLEESAIERNELLDIAPQPSAELRSKPLRDRLLQQIHAAHAANQTPVIFTSRQELPFTDTQTRLNFGVVVSALLMDLVRGLPSDIGFLISKGGITSNDVLSSGLALTSAQLLGQILPGVSIVRTPTDHSQFPGLPVVLFPGNVGDRDALAAAYLRLSQV